MAEYIGGRIVPTHGGVWDKTKKYEELTIVLNTATGDSYISKRPVPAGTEIYEEHYWVLYSQYNEQITRAEDHLDDTADAIRSEMNEQARAVNSRMEAAEENVDERAEAAEALSNQNKATLEQRMSAIEARQEANVRASTDASADYAAEVVDARVDLNGKTKASLREAIVSNHDIQSKQMALCTNGYKIDENYQWTKVAAPYKEGETITLTLDVFEADYSGGAVAVGVKSYLGTTVHEGYIMTFDRPVAKQYSKSHTFTQDVDGIIIVGLNVAAETTVESFLARLRIDDPRIAAQEAGLTELNLRMHLMEEGLAIDDSHANRKYEMPFHAGESITVTLNVTEASYTGSVAVGLRAHKDGAQLPGYFMAFDSPKVKTYTRTYTFPQDVDGFYIDGLNKSADAEVEAFYARLTFDDARFGNLQAETAALAQEDERLDGRIQDVQDALFIDSIEKKYAYSSPGITDWVYNKFAACVKAVEEDGVLKTLTYSMPKLEGDAYIEDIEMYIGTIDQRRTFLPRIRLTDFSISTVEYTSTQNLATFTFNDAPIIYEGEVVLCRISIPHAVNGSNVWTPLTNRTYESEYAVMIFDSLSSVGVLKEINFFYFDMTVKPLSDVYTTKESLGNLSKSVSTLSDKVTASATVKDVVTGGMYKLVVANGVVQAKSMDFRNIFVIGHSFSRYPNAPDIGWFRDSDDTTALCPSIRDRDYLSLLKSKLGATITNPGVGWSFERNYAVDYDFETMLTRLTSDHDCVIVFIGDNATYGVTMTASWEALFAAIHEKAPLAEIFASAPWGVSDKYTAINQAILNTSYVNLVDLALIRTKLRNASDTWEGGEYYIGQNDDYYPLWQVVASHPNDLGHYNIANAYLKAMGKETMDSILPITLNQAEGGTISTPSTSWFENAVVTIRIEAASGYQLESLTVEDSNGNTITTTARSNSMRSDGKERYYHTFIMPGTGVTVTPTWELTE